MKNFFLYSAIFVVLTASLSGCNTTQPKIGTVHQNESIAIEAPGTIEGHPGLVPVNVDIIAGDASKIAEVILEVPSNSANHQQALRLKLQEPLKKLRISTRVRLEASNDTRVRVTSIETSGRSRNQEAPIRGVVDAVDFSNYSTLSPFWEPSPLFPSRQFGERHVTFRGVPGGMFDLASAIYHPNFPAEVGSKANSMEKIQAYVGSKLIFTAAVGSALSNNPFLKVFVPKDTLDDRSGLIVKWSDSRGNQFEGSAGLGENNHQL